MSLSYCTLTALCPRVMKLFSWDNSSLSLDFPGCILSVANIISSCYNFFHSGSIFSYTSVLEYICILTHYVLCICECMYIMCLFMYV